MKHFYELPIQDIIDLFSRPWYLSEKFDGSFIRAGLDDDGKFYTERKGHYTRCYTDSDWPDLPWTNAFKGAHLALASFFDYLVDETSSTDSSSCAMKAGSYLDCEIIWQSMPNSMLYDDFLRNDIIIFASSPDIILSRLIAQEDGHQVFDIHGAKKSFIDVAVNRDIWKSIDGSSMQKARIFERWNISFSQQISFDPKYLLGIDQHIGIIKWLTSSIPFMGTLISRQDILKLKLNRRPDFINEDEYKKNKIRINKKISIQRDLIKAELIQRSNLISRLVKHCFIKTHYWTTRALNSCEGIVVYSPPRNPNEKAIIFKFVDKELFAPLNLFTHIVRYWLQGGRRPERPSFMSRTQDWPLEQRLARLEVLRQRYVSHKEKIKLSNRFFELNYRQCEELDQRTLLLFAELKQRIKNGRSGIQIQDSSDSEPRDTTDIGLVSK
jgi:hypothetical protein